MLIHRYVECVSVNLNLFVYKLLEKYNFKFKILNYISFTAVISCVTKIHIQLTTVVNCILDFDINSLYT